MFGHEGVDPALEGFRAEGQHPKRLGEIPALLGTHAAQSSPPGPLITMHLHCSFEG